jgi:phosphoenolpyruvate synthase/pyruvate phosphate dikinase
LKERFNLEQKETEILLEMIRTVEARRDSDTVEGANLIYSRLNLDKQEFFGLANIILSINNNEFSTLVKTPEALANRFSLEGDMLQKVATLLRKICQHYNDLRDIEWAVELTDEGIPGRVKIDKAFNWKADQIKVGGANEWNIQARPYTIATDREHPYSVRISNRVVDAAYIEANNIRPLMQGVAVIGAASGVIKWIDAGKPLAPQFAELTDKNIMCVEFATPEYDPGMEKAAGVVSKQGGNTSHVAIFCRENGIPALVGIGEIPRDIMERYLADGMEITIDGNNGRIYTGRIPLLDEDIRIEVNMLPTDIKGKTGLIQASDLQGQRTSTLAYYDGHYGNSLDRIEFEINKMGIYPPAGEARDNYYRIKAGEHISLNKYQKAVLEILAENHQAIQDKRKRDPNFKGLSVIERIDPSKTTALR